MFQDYVTRDGYPANPEGLSYGDPIKFQTASTLVKMASRLQDLLSRVRFPFIIFHDPSEQIVLVHGSERLLEKSLTPDVHKSIVMVEGGLHDLLSNSFTLVTEKSIDWIQSQLKIKIFKFGFRGRCVARTTCGIHQYIKGGHGGDNRFRGGHIGHIK